MSSRVRLPLEPRLLSRDMAAAYCGVSVPTFEAWCPVIPIRESNRVLYDRAKIDRWLDSLGPEAPKSAPDLAGKLRDAHAAQGH